MQFQLERAALVAATLLAAGLITATVNAQCETDALTGSESRLGWPFGNDALLNSVMSLDGDTLAVGCIGGRTYVFRRSGSVWTEEAIVRLSGNAVAVEGDTLVVGHYPLDAGTGFAEVYVRSGATWTFQQRIDSVVPVAGTGFGASVALSGDTLVVGEREADTPNVQVFVRSGGVWSLQQVLTPSGPDGFFGDPLALQGDTLVAAAKQFDVAYVFERSGTTWTETSVLTADAPLAGETFGVDVALDGTTIAVTAPTGYAPVTPSVTYVFAESGGAWSQQATLPLSVGGWSVALEGDRCLVGAMRDVAGGSATFYERSGTTWAETKKLHCPPAVGGFGNSVVLEGLTAAVLAPFAPGDQLFILDVDPSNCPGVAFEGSPLSGVAPLTVNFTDLSTGSVTSWEWYFGDDTSSDVQHPSHVYDEPGSYLVSLLVEGPGGRERGVKEDYVDALVAASATIRNGTGVNGLYLTSLTLPVMGTSWDLQIDHSNHTGATLTLLRGYLAPLTGISTSFGELLIDLSSMRFVKMTRPAAGTADLYSLPIPVDLFFVGAEGYFQGAILGGGIELTNAVDAVVGF